MKKITFFLALFFCLLIHNNSLADKTFEFTYDATGNRTTVAFISTCNERLKDTTTNYKDTIIEKAITEIINVTQPKVYPNPVRDFIIISLPILDKVASIEIYNMYGDLIFKDLEITTSQNILKVCDFAAGSYTVVVNYNSEKPYVQKIIKL